jgi:hypothetical protein
MEEWMAYHTLEPWSISQGDRRAGVLSWVMINQDRKTPVRIEDVFNTFFPDAFTQPLPTSEERLEEIRKPENQKAMWSVMKQAFSAG